MPSPRGIACFALAVAASALSCFASPAVECGNDLVCPSGTTCIPAPPDSNEGVRCAPDEDAQPCVDRDPGQTCVHPSRDGVHVCTDEGLCNLACGNGRIDIELEESCDGDKFVGTPTCIRQNFDFGRPTCSATCSPDFDQGCGFLGWNAIPDPGGASIGQVRALWGPEPTRGLYASELYAIAESGMGDTDTDRGRLFQLRDGTWTEAALPPDSDMQAIWGTNFGDIFAVGANGRILRGPRDEEGDARDAWTEMRTPTQFGLNAVWGSGPNDVYAAGDGGVLLHFDGEAWALVDTGSETDEPFTALWGSGADDVYVAGPANTVLRFDGTTWTATEGIFGDVTALWGSGPEHVFATTSGGGAFELNGANTPWSPFFELPPPYRSLYTIWGTGPDAVLAAGEAGHMIQYDGNQWQKINYASARDIRALWGPGTAEVIAGGDDTGVLRYSTYLRPTKGPDTLPLSMWGNRRDEIYAVGAEGRPTRTLAYRYDGQTWTQLASPPPGSLLTEVWGTDTDTLFAAGGGASGEGQVFRYNSEAGWTLEETPPTGRLSALSGWSRDDIYASSDDGTLLHYDGESWRRMPDAPIAEALSDLISVGPNSAFAASGPRVLQHYEGEWIRTDELGAQVYALWGTSRDHVVAAVGDDGELFRFNGESWHPHGTLGFKVEHLAGTGPNDILAFSPLGLLAHYDGVQWNDIKAAVPSKLSAVWASGADQYYIASNGRQLFELSRGPDWYRAMPRASQ